MADVQDRRGLGRPAVVAIGFAVVALLTSAIAVIVVLRRGNAPPPAPLPVAAPGPVDQGVVANDIMKLKRGVVEKVTDDKGEVVGMRLKDEGLRVALGLEPEDVLTAIGGRTLRREFDVYDATLGLSMMDASTVYVDILRDHHPVVVRWKVDGGLRTARRDVYSSPPNPFSTPRPTLGSTPFGSPASDPLVGTIQKIDDLHYEVPRATIDRLLANPAAYARQARIVPSIRSGQPDGFKVYAIRPGSLWATIGLVNGDTLRSLNGEPLTSIDKALEAYTKLQAAPEIAIGVNRRGDDETVTITVK